MKPFKPQAAPPADRPADARSMVVYRACQAHETEPDAYHMVRVELFEMATSDVIRMETEWIIDRPGQPWEYLMRDSQNLSKALLVATDIDSIFGNYAEEILKIKARKYALLYHRP